MVFGFELKLYRLFQKYFPVGVTKVFSSKSVSCSKFYNNEYLQGFDFQSKRDLSFEEI